MLIRLTNRVRHAAIHGLAKPPPRHGPRPGATSICAASMVLLNASTRIGHSQARSRITSYSADPPCWKTEPAARRNTAMVRRRFADPALRVRPPRAPPPRESPDKTSVLRGGL